MQVRQFHKNTDSLILSMKGYLHNSQANSGHTQAHHCQTFAVGEKGAERSDAVARSAMILCLVYLDRVRLDPLKN